MRYSALSLLTNTLQGNKKLKPQWRKAEPKKQYDIIIIGGGGHGLATAWYLAHTYKIKNLAVIEKSWIGSGNVGRNTTIIRANYLLPENQNFYHLALKLWGHMERDLNYNAMVSQRGITNLFHTDAQRDTFIRRGNTMRMSGTNAKIVSPAYLKKQYPLLNFDNARFPIMGGLYHKNGGTVRHDAVAWGYARAASALGVDIIENCEVTGFDIKGGVCHGVQTNLGAIKARKTALAVAGSSGQLMAKANRRLPIETHVLQAFVSEGLKPLLPGVITFGAGHFYVSQSDKGGLVFGGDIDAYNSYAQRGNLDAVEDVCQAGMALMPAIGKAKLLRSWGGLIDMSMDGSPIIDRSDISGLYFNGGWCYGGFKATPASGLCYAHLLACDEKHKIANGFGFDRFEKRRVLDEKGMGAQPNLH